MTELPRLDPLGDAAQVFRVPGGAGAYARASALASALKQLAIPAVHDAAAAYDQVAIYHEPGADVAAALADAIQRVWDATSPTESAEAHAVVVPITYDGADLDEVASRTGLTRDQVVELHAGTEYTAQAVGFVPGFAYLGELDARLRLPRRNTPRVRVPSGSVAIAGAHTAVYPFATPGGWHLVGTTDLQMFDAGRAPPALLQTGTRVRFEPR